MDKTPFIHKLTTGEVLFSVPAPPVWEKPVYQSLKSAFEGRRDLFQGLFLYDNRDWSKINPVVHWCLFIGHLVLEKTLKALYVQANNNELPPKTHNLIKLARRCNHNITEEQEIFLDEVNDFNLEVRYPQYKNEFHKKCTKQFTENYYQKINEMMIWLRSQIE